MPPADPTSAVLDGLAVARATGAPALACLAGYRRLGKTGTVLAAAADAEGEAGATDLAMLVDLAAGAAIRTTVGSGRRLATTAMAVHLLDALPATNSLTVVVPDVVVRDRTAVAAATVLAAGEPIGHASVAFTLLGDGLTPIPWEQDRNGPFAPLREADLTPDEAAGLAHVRAAGARSWSEAVLRGSTTPGADGPVLAPSALLANRAGTLQGGALVGLAVHAARGSGDDEEPVLTSVQVDFVAAAAVDQPVHSRVEVLRAGRRSRLVRVEMLQAGGLVVAATVGLRTA